MTKINLAVVAALCAFAGAAYATNITVYNPTGLLTNAGGSGIGDAVVGDSWVRRNVRSDGAVGITTNYARSGNGSAFLSTNTNTNGKADFEYFFSDAFSGGKTLGAMSGLSYDWYRSSTSNALAHYMPAFRIYVDADGNAATTNDRLYLIYERAYNPNTAAVPTDTWVTDDIFNFNGAGQSANLWQRRFSPGTTVEQYDISLQEWIAGQTTAGGLVLSADSVVYGLSFGVGSGWNSTFEGAVDNVTIGFGGNNTTWNFEVIPLPGPALMGFAGLAGLASVRRRR